MDDPIVTFFVAPILWILGIGAVIGAYMVNPIIGVVATWIALIVIAAIFEL